MEDDLGVFARKNGYSLSNQKKRLSSNYSALERISLDETIGSVCRIYEKIIANNDKNSNFCSNPTRFHSRTIPRIDIEPYVRRIHKYAPFPSHCLINSMIYLDRLSAKGNHSLLLNSYNAHRLIFTSLVISIKFHCDNMYRNTHYARVGGVGAKELKCMEFDFLAYLNYEIVTSFEDLEKVADFILASNNELVAVGDFEGFPKFRAENYPTGKSKRISTPRRGIEPRYDAWDIKKKHWNINEQETDRIMCYNEPVVRKRSQSVNHQNISI